MPKHQPSWTPTEAEQAVLTGIETELRHLEELRSQAWDAGLRRSASYDAQEALYLMRDDAVADIWRRIQHQPT